MEREWTRPVAPNRLFTYDLVPGVWRQPLVSSSLHIRDRTLEARLSSPMALMHKAKDSHTKNERKKEKDSKERSGETRRQQTNFLFV